MAAQTKAGAILAPLPSRTMDEYGLIFWRLVLELVSRKTRAKRPRATRGLSPIYLYHLSRVPFPCGLVARKTMTLPQVQGSPLLKIQSACSAAVSGGEEVGSELGAVGGGAADVGFGTAMGIAKSRHPGKFGNGCPGVGIGNSGHTYQICGQGSE